MCTWYVHCKHSFQTRVHVFANRDYDLPRCQFKANNAILLVCLHFDQFVSQLLDIVGHIGHEM
jgi:hypothetical protein